MTSQSATNGFLNKLIKSLFTDAFAVVLEIIGVILLVLTLVFGVNPLEGSVVNDAIAGTAFHWILFVTTMPAFIAGCIVGMWTVLSFPLMFVFQIILCWFLGKVIRFLFKTILRPLVYKHKTQKLE